jgi:hypothetical protein
MVFFFWPLYGQYIVYLRSFSFGHCMVSMSYIYGPFLLAIVWSVCRIFTTVLFFWPWPKEKVRKYTTYWPYNGQKKRTVNIRHTDHTMTKRIWPLYGQYVVYLRSFSFGHCMVSMSYIYGPGAEILLHIDGKFTIEKIKIISFVVKVRSCVDITVNFEVKAKVWSRSSGIFYFKLNA